MPIDRRDLITLSAVGATVPFAGVARAVAQSGSVPMFGAIDATAFELRTDSRDDQTRVLQRAIDAAATERLPLFLPPGSYRCGEIYLPAGAQLFGIRGATRLLFGGDTGGLTAARGDAITLANLTLDGGARLLPAGKGLVHLFGARGVRIVDCDIVNAGGTALQLDEVDGLVAGCTIAHAREAGIRARNSRGLEISGNRLRKLGAQGIQILRDASGDDGTLVTGNRIEDVEAKVGADSGCGIHLRNAGHVIVASNRIRRCATSAVRSDAAANLQVTDNACAALGGIAIQAMNASEGAVIQGNTIDGAAAGIAIVNAAAGGRLAVCQGNVVRNLALRRADADSRDGIGIAVEADTAITGNVVEGAPTAGIWLGWGQAPRDLSVTGNVVRAADIGIAVQVAQGTGAAVIADNLVSGTRRAAIAALDATRLVADLSRDSVGVRFAQLSVTNNRIR